MVLSEKKCQARKWFAVCSQPQPSFVTALGAAPLRWPDRSHDPVVGKPIHEFDAGEARSRARITGAPAGLGSRVEITLTVPAQQSLT
jgi:hypothetical protein